MGLTVTSYPNSNRFTKDTFSPVLVKVHTTTTSDPNNRIVLKMEMRPFVGSSIFAYFKEQPDASGNVVFDISDAIDQFLEDYDILQLTSAIAPAGIALSHYPGQIYLWVAEITGTPP